ncbi:hypothetical protein D3C76_1026020 [compost metagenome]
MLFSLSSLSLPAKNLLLFIVPYTPLPIAILKSVMSSSCNFDTELKCSTIALPKGCSDDFSTLAISFNNCSSEVASSKDLTLVTLGFP